MKYEHNRSMHTSANILNTLLLVVWVCVYVWSLVTVNSIFICIVLPIRTVEKEVNAPPRDIQLMNCCVIDGKIFVKLSLKHNIFCLPNCCLIFFFMPISLITRSKVFHVKSNSINKQLKQRIKHESSDGDMHCPYELASFVNLKFTGGCLQYFLS